MLYSDLDEMEANEMLAVLASVGIESTRNRDKNNIYSLSVETADVATAVTTLKNTGYPRENFETLGDVFSASGIVGTPFEQQARFIHAMNQELANTITSISGVRSAHVLINVPPQGRYDRETPQAGASVTVHYEASFDRSNTITMIKQIVSSSVSNLDYDDVAVAFFAAGGPEMQVRPAPEVSAPVNANIVPTGSSFSNLASFVSAHRIVLAATSGIAFVLLILFWIIGGQRHSKTMTILRQRREEQS